MKVSFSLKQTWTALILIAILVPVIVLTSWYGNNSFNNQLKSAFAKERYKHLLLRFQIESEIKRVKTLLKNKSDSLSQLIATVNRPDSLDEINRLLHQIVRRETEIRKAIVVSSKKEVIAIIDSASASQPAKLISPKRAKIIALQWGLKKKIGLPVIEIPLFGRNYIGSPEKVNDSFLFNMAVPIGTPAKGVLIVAVDVDKLWSMVNTNSPISDKYETTINYILDRRGSLITSIEESNFKPGVLMTHLEMVRSALVGDNWSERKSYLGLKNVPVFTSTTTIPVLYWTLVSEVPTTQITQPIFTSLITIASATLLGVLIFIGIILYLAKRTLNPIQQASTAIAQVAHGDYKLSLNSIGIKEFDAMLLGIVNMTEARRAAESALQESKQDLAITLNSIADAVITTDPKGNVTRMNPVAEKLTGWTSAEAKGVSLTEVFPIVNAKTRETIENPIDKVIATGETIYLSDHTTLIAKDRTEHQIADSAAPIVHNNKIMGMVLVFNDVTEQYKLREKAFISQQKLKVKEQEQRDMLNSMVSAVISIDARGTILHFNKAAEELFAYSFEEVRGMNVSCLMPEPFASEHCDYLLRYIKTGEARVIGMGRNVDGKRKNGEIFPMRLHIAELPEDRYGVRRFVGSCVDLTRVNQQEELLRRSQKMDALGKLTGGIAHDYNNMLGVIMGYADLLTGLLSDQPVLEKYAQQIYRAGQRGAKLTQRLLSFSRQENPEASKLNINNLLREQQDMLQKTLTVRVKLVMDLDEELWSIWLDYNDLEDAIINMSINAMHAMGNQETESQLTIQTRNKVINRVDATALNLDPGSYVILSIKDTGSGMEETVKERIFDPFFSTKGDEGTGFGLSQVFGFVKRAGGAIDVSSEPNKGSEFNLYFPRYMKDMSIDDKVENRVDQNYRGEESILLVDDEVALLDLTSELLTAKGYHVFKARSGIEALSILEVEKIDLILSDVIMPDMDGAQLAAIAQEKYPEIMIQLASGFADESHIGSMKKSLHKKLLRKPYSADALYKSIRNLLDKAQ